MKQHPRYLSGFSLVEVAISIGIASFCLVSILGLIPAGLNVAANASSQTGAVNVLQAVASDLRDVPLTGGTCSPYFKFSIPDTAGKTIFVDEGNHYDTNIQNVPAARYRVEVKTIYQPTGSNRSATTEQVVISWPPRASISAAVGITESVLALDRN